MARKKYYRRHVPPGTRCFIHLTTDEFTMLGLNETAPGTFREPSANGMRLLAGDMVVGDPYLARFDIRLERLVVTLPWNRLIESGLG